MKVSLNLLIAFTLILLSCNKNNKLTTLKSKNGFSYVESLDEWKKLKETNGNAYKYETTFTSWAGFGNTTEIKVQDGKVTARVYEEFTINDTTGARVIADSYTETAADLGSHEKGAPPLTIDELYDSCAKKYLTVDDKKNILHFETQTNGLMNLCGFTPKNCMDDCYTGIQIDSFNWAK